MVLAAATLEGPEEAESRRTQLTGVQGAPAAVRRPRAGAATAGATRSVAPAGGWRSRPRDRRPAPSGA